MLEFRTADGLDALLALVADGIGGSNSGEMASHIVEDTVPRYVADRAPASGEISRVLVEALSAANTRICETAQENRGRAGLGTTCTAVVVVGHRLYLAHIGDSRAYLVRGGRAQQLTIDHNFLQEQLEIGRPWEEIRDNPNLGLLKRYLGLSEQAKIDTRYLPAAGSDAQSSVDSSQKPFVLQDGDSLLLCTDGVSGVLPDDKLAAMMSRFRASDNRSATALVDAALRAGTSDNATAVTIDLPGKVLLRGGGAMGPRWALVLVFAAVLLIGGGGFLGWTLLHKPQPTPSPAATRVAQSTAMLATPVATALVALSNATSTPWSAGALAPTAVEVVSGPTATPLLFAPGMQSEGTPSGGLIAPIGTRSPGPEQAPTPTSALSVTATAAIPAGGVAAPALVSPPNGSIAQGTVNFMWQPVQLPSGAGYEVVVWNKGESPASARGVHDPVSRTSLPVRISDLFSYSSGQPLLTTKQFYWTVLVSYPGPSYVRVTDPASADGPWSLTYQPPPPPPPPPASGGNPKSKKP